MGDVPEQGRERERDTEAQCSHIADTECNTAGHTIACRWGGGVTFYFLGASHLGNPVSHYPPPKGRSLLFSLSSPSQNHKYGERKINSGAFARGGFSVVSASLGGSRTQDQSSLGTNAKLKKICKNSKI